MAEAPRQATLQPQRRALAVAEARVLLAQARQLQTRLFPVTEGSVLLLPSLERQPSMQGAVAAEAEA
jgi:hypothetical protein